ncbi:hypothetical protein GCT13_29350 [Paraburkholderia sp. CNPSo 3157]|uniref:O-antigen ligase domain-containing protein n=2 Tax=Paraburkholderia franconis TaxID=2654983 RepID=A0A7X1TIU6_9BURK|nr:hypothetical protein [Paraburkholderia franconis]
MRGFTKRNRITLTSAVFAIGMVLSPIADFLSVRASYGFEDAGDSGRYSLLVRGGMVFGLILVMLMRKRMKTSSLRTAFFAIAAIAVSTVAWALGGISIGEYLQQSVLVLKVFSFFVFFAALSGMDDRQIEGLQSLIRLSLLVYALSIVAGAVFSIDLFRSYWGDTQIRSGYKGIIYAQNEASALMIVGLAYGLQRVLRSGWTLFNAFLTGSIFIASLLVGTKAAAIGALMTTCSYLYARYSLMRATLQAATVISLVAGAAISVYLTSQNVRDAVDLSVRYFTYQHEHANGERFLTVLLSGRNVKFSKIWDDVSQKGFVPLLTGGYPVVRYLIEIDVLDLTLALGLPVFTLYLCWLGKAFIHRSRGCIQRFGKLFFIVLMATAATAGHILVSALVGPYLAIIAVYLSRAGRTVKPVTRNPLP